MLASPYDQEAKFEQQRFTSTSLQEGFCDPPEPNSAENVLKQEVEPAKETLKQGEDKGVCLMVSLTDIHAQENPKKISDPGISPTHSM